MVAQCEEVMRCQLCRVALDQSKHPGATMQLFLPGMGLRTIIVSDYDWFREPQNRVESSGRHTMCVRVEQAMIKPDSPRGLAARALFRRDWVIEEYCPPTGLAARALWKSQ